MAKATSFITALLNLVFKNVALANVGDASGLQPSASAGNLYWSLHTASPGAAGDQTTSECTYTGYARVAAVRGAGFTVSGTQVVPAATVTFPTGSGGSAGPATHFGIGTASSGAGVLLYYGTVTPNEVTGSGYTPTLSTATAINEG